MGKAIRTGKRKKLIAAFNGYLISALACMWIAFGVCAITAIFTDGFLITLFGWMTYIICMPVLGYKLNRFFFKNFHLLENRQMNISARSEIKVNKAFVSPSNPSNPAYDLYYSPSSSWNPSSMYYRRDE